MAEAALKLPAKRRTFSGGIVFCRPRNFAPFPPNRSKGVRKLDYTRSEEWAA
jgi:hypothetical protein